MMLIQGHFDFFFFFITARDCGSFNFQSQALHECFNILYNFWLAKYDGIEKLLNILSIVFLSSYFYYNNFINYSQ